MMMIAQSGNGPIYFDAGSTAEPHRSPQTPFTLDG